MKQLIFFAENDLALNYTFKCLKYLFIRYVPSFAVVQFMCDVIIIKLWD